MKTIWKGDLKEGDKVILYYMEGETSVPMGTRGVVTRVVRDPFGDADDKLYEMQWDNGSRLSLSSQVDAWKKIVKSTPKSDMNESHPDSHFDAYVKQNHIYKFFDVNFLKKYLKAVQKSGIVNMFESPYLLYSGPEYIERYYGEGKEDDEDFNEVLELSQKSKDKMIQGTIKYLESKGIEVDLDSVNREIRKLSKDMFLIYVNHY